MSAIKGRGAPTNTISGRFSLPARQIDGDWLDEALAGEDAPPPLRTTVTQERARTIISRNTSPDVGFDQSVNAYRGCEQRHTVALQFLGKLSIVALHRQRFQGHHPLARRFSIQILVCNMPVVRPNDIEATTLRYRIPANKIELGISPVIPWRVLLIQIKNSSTSRYVDRKTVILWPVDCDFFAGCNAKNLDPVRYGDWVKAIVCNDQPYCDRTGIQEEDATKRDQVDRHSPKCLSHPHNENASCLYVHQIAHSRYA